VWVGVGGNGQGGRGTCAPEATECTAPLGSQRTELARPCWQWLLCPQTPSLFGSQLSDRRQAHCAWQTATHPHTTHTRPPGGPRLRSGWSAQRLMGNPNPNPNPGGARLRSRWSAQRLMGMLFSASRLENSRPCASHSSCRYAPSSLACGGARKAPPGLYTWHGGRSGARE
jgi:hypothetical protein